MRKKQKPYIPTAKAGGITATNDKIIEQSEESTLEDINATTTALTQVLKLNFNEEEDFR